MISISYRRSPTRCTRLIARAKAPVTSVDLLPFDGDGHFTLMRRNLSIWATPVGQFSLWLTDEELTMKRVAVFGNTGGGKSMLAGASGLTGLAGARRSPAP
jgi:hypothetical protein